MLSQKKFFIYSLTDALQALFWNSQIFFSQAKFFSILSSHLSFFASQEKSETVVLSKFLLSLIYSKAKLIFHVHFLQL